MSKSFDELMETMRKLRAPGGCPWDREQTHSSLAPYLLEECYETFEAIEKAEKENDKEPLKEELGDVLLQVVFHSVIAEEKGDFTIDDIIKNITEKLILRHPHVFGDENLKTKSEVLQNWDRLKANEREKRGKQNHDSVLESIPTSFPALLEALKITKQVAKVGFDWESVDQVFEKLQEEIKELKEAIEKDEKSKIEEELGDLLFTVVNLARKLEVEPETALKRTNLKFRQRFQKVETELKKSGKRIEETELSEMDALWEKAKI
jgi:MazG family protein